MKTGPKESNVANTDRPRPRDVRKGRASPGGYCSELPIGNGGGEPAERPAYIAAGTPPSPETIDRSIRAIAALWRHSGESDAAHEAFIKHMRPVFEREARAVLGCVPVTQNQSDPLK